MITKGINYLAIGWFFCFSICNSTRPVLHKKDRKRIVLNDSLNELLSFIEKGNIEFEVVEYTEVVTIPGPPLPASFNPSPTIPFEIVQIDGDNDGQGEIYIFSFLSCVEKLKTIQIKA
ncbi:hypothetical protein AAG747_11100 [Rapidithrix thailandica]|uniref:Uncharacterized protein n=1 Tax=Rapidithrix thailandica TaxID=413964 RepID=A0AAW9RUN3_9BACT